VPEETLRMDPTTGLSPKGPKTETVGVAAGVCAVARRGRRRDRIVVVVRGGMVVVGGNS
jgi:hypothetical protein